MRRFFETDGFWLSLVVVVLAFGLAAAVHQGCKPRADRPYVDSPAKKRSSGIGITPSGKIGIEIGPGIYMDPSTGMSGPGLGL